MFTSKTILVICSINRSRSNSRRRKKSESSSSSSSSDSESESSSSSDLDDNNDKTDMEVEKNEEKDGKKKSNKKKKKDKKYKSKKGSTSEPNSKEKRRNLIFHSDEEENSAADSSGEDIKVQPGGMLKFSGKDEIRVFGPGDNIGRSSSRSSGESGFSGSSRASSVGQYNSMKEHIEELGGERLEDQRETRKILHEILANDESKSVNRRTGNSGTGEEFSPPSTKKQIFTPEKIKVTSPEHQDRLHKERPQIKAVKLADLINGKINSIAAPLPN